MRPRGSRSPRDRGGRQCSCLHQHMCPVHKACSPLRRRPRISPLGTRRKWMQPWRRAQRMRCPRRTTYTRKDQWRPRSFLCCKQSSWRWPPCWADTCQEDTGCKRARHWCSHTCPGCKRGRRGRYHPRSCLRTPGEEAPILPGIAAARTAHAAARIPRGAVQRPVGCAIAAPPAAGLAAVAIAARPVAARAIVLAAGAARHQTARCV